MEKSKPITRRTRKRDVPLTEAGIYTAALRLVDAGGVDALSMRKLAAELGANPMSLYHHVENKESLLRGVAALVGAEFHAPAAEALPWPERLRRLAADFRALAHRHPNLMAYSFRRADFVQPQDPFWLALVDTLRAAGVPERDVHQRSALICALICGLLQAELNGALRRWSTLGAAPDAPETDMDGLFSAALDTVISGIDHYLAAPPANPDENRPADPGQR